MKRMIALLLLLCTLTACASGAPEAAEPMAEAAPKEEPAPAEDAMAGTATFSQAAPEPLACTVTLEALTDSAQAEDGTVLVSRSYHLPVMTVERQDGTAVTEASTPAETAALAAAETFNEQFQSWAASDNFDEVVDRAAEVHDIRAEAGEAAGAWEPFALELNCSVYQTEQMVSVRAEYYSYMGGAHPNTVLLAWNFDLGTGQFFTPELLAADGQAFSQAVTEELIRQSRETAASYDMAPEDFFWPNYQEILAGWSSYAVSFDETGMTVGFSPYELAAYAAGAQIYHLDYGQIAGDLSSHGLAVLGLAAVEK